MIQKTFTFKLVLNCWRIFFIIVITREIVTLQILVKEQDQKTPSGFEVRVTENGSQLDFQVTLSDALYQKLSVDRYSKTDCIKAAFRFLLDREPKESILRRFDLSVISNYFPEFQNRISDYLQGIK